MGFHRETKEKVVIKKFSKKPSISRSKIEQYLKDVIREKEILFRLDHKFVVKARDFLEDQTNYYLVMDLCETTLYEKIQTKNKDGSSLGLAICLEHFR